MLGRDCGVCLCVDVTLIHAQASPIVCPNNKGDRARSSLEPNLRLGKEIELCPKVKCETTCSILICGITSNNSLWQFSFSYKLKEVNDHWKLTLETYINCINNLLSWKFLFFLTEYLMKITVHFVILWLMSVIVL